MRRSGKNIHNYVVDSSDDDDDGDEQQDLFADNIVEQERVALVVPATDTSSTSRFSPSGHGGTSGRKLVATISIVLFGLLLLVVGISWIKKPNFALDDSSAKPNHHHYHHHQEDSSIDTFPPSLYQPHPQQATLFSCANIFPNDVTWKSWLHATSNRPATERCGPRVTDPTECTCHSPAVPWDKSSSSTNNSGKSSNPWKQTFQRNKGLVKQALQHEQQRPLDIIFYGDSITEHWWGTDLGKVQGRYKGVAATYLKYFRGSNNATTTTTTTTTLNGLALGIGGDRCPNLLYRIMAGEMPDELLQRAKIVWLLIGTNDFGGEHCSADMVTAGILWITQVIRKQQEAVGNSNAHVVLNSLLPRGRKRLTTTGVPSSSSSSSASNLWPHMQVVNHALECYAAGDTSGRVHFFNATSLFTTDDDLFVNMTLMVDALHPNGLGSELWAQAITDYTLNLISSSSSSKDGGAVKKFGKEPSPFEDTSSLETCEENLLDGSTTWENWVKQQGKATDRCPTEFENHNEQPQQQRGKCDCPNPVHAQPRSFPDWDRAHERNVQLVEDQISLTQEGGRPLDFLLLGDSITEFWSGYSMGSKHPKLNNNVRVYQELFRSNTSAVRGLGLGIAGDRVVHLLYRLLNGELPDKLNAPIIWLLIGTNDLPRNRCNAETVTAGILNVVALLRQSKPTAKVVINSILPRDRSPLVSSPTWKLISTVNERLECYAAHRPDVYFYNATSIFLTGTGDKIRVDHSIMPDFLHPNAAGYQRWGNEIVKQVLRMLAHGP